MLSILDDWSKMTGKTHSYELTLEWTGNLGPGTTNYRAYARSHAITGPNKPIILGSSDPNFLGDDTRWNPEELLVASLSQCHLLWYLGIAAGSGVVVTGYTDTPTGTMIEEPDGAGQFSAVTLHPVVTIADERNHELAMRLHDKAHAKCFIARSVNFTVRHEPTIQIAPESGGGQKAPQPPTAANK